MKQYSLVNFKEQFGIGEDSLKKLNEKLTTIKLDGSSLFKEYFDSAEGSDMVPAQFLSQIILGATSNPLFRAFSKTISQNSGESIYIRRASDEQEAQVVAEGSEKLIDETDYEKSEFVYRKIMKRPSWSYEVLADTPLDLIGTNNFLMGAKVSQKEDQLGLADIYYWSSGARATLYANTVTPAAATYLPNLIDAVVDLPLDSDGFYKADTIIMDGAGYKLLLKDADLPDAAFWGGITFIQTGSLAKILGCSIYVRELKKYSGDFQNPYEVLCADTASTYVIDSRFAFAVIDRIPLTIDNFDIPAKQLKDANIWTRTILGILQPRAYRRLTAKTT